MADDQTFHRILVFVSLVIFPITLFHRIRSQATGESLDRWQEGAFILFTLRAIGGATMIGFIAYLVNPAWMAWSRTMASRRRALRRSEFSCSIRSIRRKSSGA